VNSMNCRASVSTAVLVGAGIAAWIVLCANAAQSAIVEISGAAEPSPLNSYLAGNSPANPFYVHKATIESQTCGGNPSAPYRQENCPLSTNLQAIDEQQQVTLSSPVATSNPGFAQVPLPFGSPYGWQKPGPTIPAGQIVNSHYIWLNSPGGTLSHDIATFRFDGPILGIVGKPEDMIATNGTLGFDVATGPPGSNLVSYTPTGSTACTPICFVNEDYPNNPTNPPSTPPYSGDIVIRVAPAIMTMDFSSYSGDYIRVVTAANVPLHTGDFDHDYDVDNDDYAIWRLTFGSISDLRADANGDAVVDAGDFVAWRDNNGYAYVFPGAGGGSGAEVPFGAIVPEPGSAAVLLGCILFNTLPRHRRRVDERKIAR
jgi:hypothetical protein